MPTKQQTGDDGRDGPLSTPEFAGTGDGRDPRIHLDSSMASELILYRDLYENAPCGYLILDLDGAITSANRTFLDIIKLPKAEGLRFRSLLYSRRSSVLRHSSFPRSSSRGNRGEVALDLRAGKERLPVLAYFSVVRDENGNSGIRAALFSAKERRLFEKDLVRSRREAEQLSEVICTRPTRSLPF